MSEGVSELCFQNQIDEERTGPKPQKMPATGCDILVHWSALLCFSECLQGPSGLRVPLVGEEGLAVPASKD